MEVGSAGSLRSLISVAVQKKQLDSTRDQGQAAVELIEAAKQPANPRGTGTRVNVVA